MKQYLDLCERIINEGVWVENKRTGQRVKTIINADFTYNVDQGQFPMITTRKTFYKAAIGELLGYLTGTSDALVFKEKYKTPTWLANANENEAWLKNPYRKGENDMGQAYRFRKKVHYIEIKENFKEKPEIQNLPNFEKIEPDFTNNKHELIGKIFSSNNYGDFKVIKESSDDRKTFTIQFEKSGYIKDNVMKGEITSGEVKDVYYPSVFGIACEGIVDKNDEDYKLLKGVWNNLIQRCYVIDSKWYYDDGRFVSDDWLVFANFMKDAKSIPNWHLKKVFPSEYSLDKDLYNSNYYSKETCRWNTAMEQTMNKRDVRTFKVTENEKDFIVKSNKKLTELVGGSTHFRNELSKTKAGDKFNHNGFEIEVLPYNTFCYIESDQVKSVYAKLKCNYDDRGLIMNAWHEELEPYSCLRPCMYEHQFSILDGTLYLNSTQRSIDVPLGLVFNQIQVYVLLALMAQITGLKPGKAYHKLVNAHIYENQIELMKEQIKREPFDLPTLKINPDIKSLEDIETWVTVDDFVIEGYQHHEPIQYPFSV